MSIRYDLLTESEADLKTELEGDFDADAVLNAAELFERTCQGFCWNNSNDSGSSNSLMTR